MVLAFGDFELDDTAYELRRGGETVKLEPKVFDVLRHMIAYRERVVPKTEFLEVLWPGEYVTESALPRAVAAARKALRDDRERQRFIRTVHGRGYQFVAPVEEREEGGVARRRSADAPPVPPRIPREATAPAFVGREAVLERLEAALEDAAAGRGRLVLLFGEPGIGKTRTAQELAERARARGFEAVVGRCYQGEGAPAFSLLGLVGLQGVVVNDSLILVHRLNALRRGGASLEAAIEGACLSRFRPIVVTTATTFLGLMPLLFETSTQAQWIKPMAVSLAFGELFSTVIVLVLLPAAIRALQDLGMGRWPPRAA